MCQICRDINNDAKSINDHLHGSKHQTARNASIPIQINVEPLVRDALEMISFQTPEFPLSLGAEGNADLMTPKILLQANIEICQFLPH